MARIKNWGDFEEILKRRVAEKVIKGFLRKFGVTIRVLRKRVSEQHLEENPEAEAEDLVEAAYEIYGAYSGLSSDTPVEEEEDEFDSSNGVVDFEACVLFVNINMNPFDAAMAGSLEQETIYTTCDIKSNDILELRTEIRMNEDCQDGAMTYMRVGKILEIGKIAPVYRRWEVHQIAGGLI